MTVLDVAGAARLLAVSPDTVREWARRRKIPATKLGKSWRFSGEQLVAHIEAAAQLNVKAACHSTVAPTRRTSGFGSQSAAAAFAEAAKRYLTETAGKRSADKDAQILRWFLETREFSETPLHEIERNTLAAARAKLAEGLSETTVNHYMATVRAVLRRAQLEWEWIDSAPKVPMFRRRLAEPRWITRSQFGKLLKHLPAHTADLARFAVATGLRRSNITGLTWDRVDLRRRTAYIPAGEAKAGRGIPVALNADAIAVLKRWKGKDERWVFVYRRTRITQVATKAWRRACVQAGVPGLRFHDLRHTWASWQVQAETPLSVLQEMGGWQSFEMVRRYAHLSPGHLRQYADRTLLKR